MVDHTDVAKPTCPTRSEMRRASVIATWLSPLPFERHRHPWAVRPATPCLHCRREVSCISLVRLLMACSPLLARTWSTSGAGSWLSL